MIRLCIKLTYRRTMQNITITRLCRIQVCKTYKFMLEFLLEQPNARQYSMFKEDELTSQPKKFSRKGLQERKVSESEAKRKTETGKRTGGKPTPKQQKGTTFKKGDKYVAQNKTTSSSKNWSLTHRKTWRRALNPRDNKTK